MIFQLPNQEACVNITLARPLSILFELLCTKYYMMKQRILILCSMLASTVAAFGQDIDMKDEVLVFDEATGTAKVGVIVKNKNASPTTINVAVVSIFGTANSADMTLATTQLTFNATSPDPDTQYINVTINNDMAAESQEYFALRLSNAVNGTIGDMNTVVYIKDNDYSPPVPRKNISLEFKGRYTMPASGSSAEILAYDSASNKIYSVNSLKNVLQILSFANPASVAKLDSVDMSVYGGGINSVAVMNGMVAVAVEASPKTDSGSIVILDTNGNLLKQVKAGSLPDMITFTPDGKYILTANEGEPNSAYTIDPEGSVTIVDITNGAANATATTIRFNSFNGVKASLIAQGVRIFGYNNPTVAQDFEPEYITINKNGDTAYVGLQENNAVAVLDIANKNFVRIMPLGYVDHSQPGKGIDGSDRNPEPLIANWPVRGLYMPDAIASYTAGNNTYIVFTNEGDAREYDPFEEESRISSGSYDLDPAKFPEGDLYKKSYCIGRLAATNTLGDTDNDGDFDEIYVFGTRGFVIKNAATGATAFESGDQFERITLADPKVGKIFNASNSDNDARTRSDAKGPEPEAVAIGSIHDTTYAFIGLERMGGVMVYDISNPSAPVFVDYINTRDTAAFGGDNGPEDIKFLHADKNPHGKYYLLVSNEVSATVAVFEVKVSPVSVQNIYTNLNKLNVYPNPVVNGQVFFSATISGVLMDVNGRTVSSFNAANSINTANLPAGVYILNAEGFAPVKVVVQ